MARDHAERNCSQPWSNDEMIQVDSTLCCYDLYPHSPISAMVIYLPGGRKITLAEAQILGMQIRLPKKFRMRNKS